ncbi:hypothetical protein N0V94_001313 [Neodidymelliopsis sp. IMI 364377]|nr:hypothetical protein N0V94_001313 [Neodidymelliopsis sp. IMI 364377]
MLDAVFHQGYTIEMKGETRPFQKAALDDIIVIAPQEVRAVPEDPRATVNGKTVISKSFTDIPLLSTLKWGVPQNKDSRQRFLRVLQLLLEHSEENVFCGDFEGVSGTRTGLAAIPTQIGMVRPATNECYTSYIKYDYASTEATVQGLQTEEVINYKAGWTTRLVNLHTAMFYNTSSKDTKPSLVRLQDLLNMGFDEDRALFVAWVASKMDSTSLSRILRQRDGLTVPIEDVGIRSEWSLSLVYAIYYPDDQDTRVLSFHDALFDARVLVELWQVARDGAKDL